MQRKWLLNIFSPEANRRQHSIYICQIRSNPTNNKVKTLIPRQFIHRPFAFLGFSRLFLATEAGPKRRRHESSRYGESINFLRSMTKDPPSNKVFRKLHSVKSTSSFTSWKADYFQTELMENSSVIKYEPSGKLTCVFLAFVCCVHRTPEANKKIRNVVAVWLTHWSRVVILRSTPSILPPQSESLSVLVRKRSKPFIFKMIYRKYFFDTNFSKCIIIRFISEIVYNYLTKILHHLFIKG